MKKKVKKNILIIDDEPMWLDLVTRFLEHKGYGVYTASNGAAALASLPKLKPDLILSDVRMPEMNGFELLNTVKQSALYSATPIILFSVLDDFDARKTAQSLGAADYVIKPTSEEEIDLVLSKVFPASDGTPR
jgi:YesN/AraC family two-component response regulator